MALSNDGGDLKSYTEVVRELSDVSIHDSVGVGLCSGTFRAGTSPNSVVFEISCEAGREQDAIPLLLASMFRAVPTKDRVTSTVANLHSDATESIRYGETMCRALARLLDEEANERPYSNVSLMTVIRQHPLYTKLMKADPDEIIADLVELQSILIRTAPFFQVAARSPMDVLNIVRGAWTAEGGQLVEDGETHFKQVYVRTASGSVSSRSVIAPIVGVESAYMQVLVECDVPRQHEDFYPLEVLCEWLSRVEGPLEEGVRGAGLAYGVSVSYRRGRLTLSIDESTAPQEAWEVFVKQLEKMMAPEWEPFEFELDAAKSSLLYQMHSGRMSPAMVADRALRGATYGVLFDEAEDMRREKRLNAVTPADVKRVFVRYFSRFSQSEGRIVVVTCGHGEVDAIKKGFVSSANPLTLETETLDEIMSEATSP